MVDLALLQSVSYIAGALGVCVAAIYYVMTLRSQQINMKANLETRQAQLLMGIHQILVKPEMMAAGLKLQSIEMKNVNDWNQLCKDEEKYKAWTLWAAFYQGIGTLVKEKMIDVGLPAQMYGGNLLWFWEKYRDMNMDCREKLSWPGWGVETEFLYNSILEYGRLHPELGLSHAGRKLTVETE